MLRAILLHLNLAQVAEFLVAFQNLSCSADELFQVVSELALPDAERLLEAKREMKHAHVARLRDKNRQTKVKGLARAFPMFSVPELEVVFDRFDAFVRSDSGGAGIDFVAFCKLLPTYCQGWFHAMGVWLDVGGAQATD